jgi:hypothetical protein
MYQYQYPLFSEQGVIIFPARFVVMGCLFSRLRGMKTEEANQVVYPVALRESVAW